VRAGRRARPRAAALAPRGSARQAARGPAAAARSKDILHTVLRDGDLVDARADPYPSAAPASAAPAGRPESSDATAAGVVPVAASYVRQVRAGAAPAPKGRGAGGRTGGLPKG
jgi:hypothetical protein